jgi:hypothetical protein
LSQRDDPVSVDHVGGNPDALKRVFDIAAEFLQIGHGTESALPRMQSSTTRRDEGRRCCRSPTLTSAVPNWSSGDTIPLGAGRTLRVVDVRD